MKESLLITFETGKFEKIGIPYWYFSYMYNGIPNTHSESVINVKKNIIKNLPFVI